LLRTGRMNALGRFEDPTEFVVAPSDDRPITFSESDVNALAQAKGANVAGLQIAIAEYGIRYSDLDVFYLAGGFGRHLNLESSKRIGLIPNIDASKIVQVGNASVEGACIALLSRAKRAELENLVRRIIHCRLETHPGFFDYFVEGCQFAPVGGTEEVAES
ncbi:MAG TPA: ASKHA domain-containing protein, partial [Opitutus sp.]|nr:ASKHA domain-containing protein [Opitutus sp.]